MEGPKQLNNQPLDTEELQSTISAAVSWFILDQESNGHFLYEYIPFLDRYSDDDNIVRQAGALYGLGEMTIRDVNNKYDVKETMESAISYFVENTREGEFNGQKFRCILKKETYCSLGAVSLAVIGIIDLVEKNPELEGKYSDLIEDYIAYILAMKLDGAGFRGSFYFGKKQNKTESPFANGEAFLALVKYYERNPRDEVKVVIDESFDYFRYVYGEEWDRNFYLWGMAAIKILYQIDIDRRFEYFEFVRDYTDWRMEYYASRRNSTRNNCAYFEGVISAYSVLYPNISEERRAYYMEEIDYWLTRISGYQVEEGDLMRLQFNNNKGKKVKLTNPERAIGGFLTALQEPVLRIDFTQHCLNSYVQKLIDIDGEEY